MKELKDCGVIFHAQTHTYTLGNRQLRGITPILHKYICPEKYDDVPAAVLAKAAARGTAIHNMVEAIVEGFIPQQPTEEQAAFLECAGALKWTTTEYIVTDRENFASAIDIVGEYGDDPNAAILADIKTTAVLDIDYLRWQLSIYAYLFERQTGIKVAKLYAIHLRNGKGKLVEVERIDDAIVEGLLSASATGADWANPLKGWQPSEEQVAKLRVLEQQLQKLDAAAKSLKEERDRMANEICKEMERRCYQNIAVGGLSFTFKAGYTRKTVDADKLKTEHPDIYADCIKETTTKASLTIKIIDK